MKGIAQAISIIFHPIFYFTYVFVSLFYFGDEFLPYRHTFNVNLILGYVVLNTIIIPVSIVYMVNRDFQLKEAKDRFKPIIIVAALYLLVFFFFKRLLLPPLLMKYLLSISIGLFVIAVLSRFYKVSLHTTGAGSVVMLFIALAAHSSGLYLNILFIVVLIAGIIGSSRMYLEEHSIIELVTGYIIGMFSVGLLLLL